MVAGGREKRPSGYRLELWAGRTEAGARPRPAGWLKGEVKDTSLPGSRFAVKGRDLGGGLGVTPS